MESCDGVIKSNVFKQEFAAIGIGSYRKNDNEISRILMKDTYIQNARINAERINQQTKDAALDDDLHLPYRLKPYTDVHLLLDAIDEIASK